MVEKFCDKEVKNGNFSNQMDFRKKSDIELKSFQDISRFFCNFSKTHGINNRMSSEAQTFDYLRHELQE